MDRDTAVFPLASGVLGRTMPVTASYQLRFWKWAQAPGLLCDLFELTEVDDTRVGRGTAQDPGKLNR